MIYPMVPFPVTLTDSSPRFQGRGVIFMFIDAFSVFCAQLTRDMLAIAKFLFFCTFLLSPLCYPSNLWTPTADIYTGCSIEDDMSR